MEKPLSTKQCVICLIIEMLIFGGLLIEFL